MYMYMYMYISSQITDPCCTSCCSILQSSHLSMSLSQCVGASVFARYISVVQQHHQLRLEFLDASQLNKQKSKRKQKQKQKQFPKPIQCFCTESSYTVKWFLVSRIGQYGALFSHNMGASPASSVLISSARLAALVAVLS